MEFKNIEQLYSSEHSHIFLVEGSDGKLYTKKDSGISPEVADKLGNVRSPYVAALADYGEDYTILEYAQGTPLNEVKLTPKRACEIFRELCDGISALHRERILHRDIKPSNVIVCDDGHIKIIDFDAARIKKPAADKDTVFMGTDGFAPPEQFGFTQTDERSDIYALGVTFKVILGENYQRSRYRHIIDKCTRFNPEQRYKSIGAVKRALALCEYMWTLCAAGVLLIAGCLVCVCVNSKRDEPQEESSGFTTYGSIDANGETVPQVLDFSTDDSTDGPKTIGQINDVPALNDFEVPANSQRPIPWELLWLPEGFPKLADGVTKYSTQGGSIFLEWDKMSLEEAQYISALLQQWIGVEKGYGSNDNKIYSDTYFTDEYSATINRYTDRAVNGRNQASVNVQAEFPDLSLTYDPSGINDIVTRGSGNILWEDMDFLSEERLADMPRLTDYVTEIYRDKYWQNIYWDKMSVLETAAMAYRVSEWLGTYPLIRTYDSSVEWIFDNFYIKWYDTDVYGGYQTEVIIHDDFKGTD